MATIALYAGKLNQMPSLIGEVKQSVDDYASELFSLKSKALNVRKSVCDLDDVIEQVQASTQLQEQKAESLEAFRQKTEEFTAEVVRIDEEVASVINQRKEEFYNTYNYLKPDCEKNLWEKICDGFAAVAEWCKEHWREIVATAVIIVGAILAIAAVVMTGGAALVPLLTTLLTTLGVSAGAAMTAATVISFTVAIVSVLSTIGSSTLNIIDIWGDIDNPTFNAWQTALSWTSMISNGLYSIGSIYNGIKGIQNSSLRTYSKNWITNSEFRNAIIGADKFQLNVQPNTSTFWAGLGKDGQYIAKAEATSLGRSTLESTIESQNIPTPVGSQEWSSASASYAMRSSGDVTALLNTGELGKTLANGNTIGQTWLNIERVILNVNPHVTSINGILRTWQSGSFLSGLFSGAGSAVSSGLSADN